MIRVCKTTRRRFLLGAVLGAPLAIVADARWLEPGWLKVRRLRLAGGKPTHRIIHFTDLHHKGNRRSLLALVNQINRLAPDFVCFTGDLVEEKGYLPEALELLRGIKSPLYGVPGNHDYWSKVVFSDIDKAFAATGGGWLLNQRAVTHDGKIALYGSTSLTLKFPPPRPDPVRRNILLMHYPAWVKHLAGVKFDLLLAGHSHGGQVRLPLYGPVYVPFGVDEYVMGLFRTPSGPLYVNPGIGWFPFPIRFNCRPEVTVIDFD